MIDPEDSKWRDGFRKGFLAAIDGMKREYSEDDLQAFVDQELKEWFTHPGIRKWPPRIFDTRKPSPR